MNRLRSLADATAAAVPPAAIIITAAVLAELPAAEVARTEIRNLGAQLRGAAALLPPPVFVAGLTKLTAAIPAPVLAPIVLAVPVGLVPAPCFGVFLTQAEAAQDPERGCRRTADGEAEAAPGPRVELGVVQLSSLRVPAPWLSERG